MNNLEQIRNTSLLEVTINSTKLNELLESISCFLDKQNIKIKSNNQNIINRMDLLQNQFNIKFEKLLMKFQGFDLRLKQDIHDKKMYIKSVEKQCQGKLVDMNKKIEYLNRLIMEVKQENKVDCKYIESVLKKQINENQEINQQKNHFIDAWVVNLGEKIKKIQMHTRQEMEKVTNILAEHQKKIHQVGQDINNQLHKTESQQEDKNFGTITPQDEFFIKKYPKARKRCDSTQMLKFATISAKLQDLQHRLNQKDNLPLNKIIYPKINKFSPKMSIHNNLSSSKQFFIHNNGDNSKVNNNIQSQLSNGFIQNNQQKGQINIVQENIYKKIKILDDYMFQQINILKNQINFIKNKNSIFEQKLGILNRKVQKQHIINNDSKQRIKKIQQKKVDQNLIQSLLNQIKIFKTQIQQLLQSKVSKQSFEIQKVKMNDRANIIHQNLSEKADKGQIKKAFLFLQDKIKQIIILIADQKNYEKDGVITKLPFKCLSCDRDLDINLKNLQTPKSTPNNNMSLRSLTSKIKKRIKLSGNISVPKTVLE